MRRRVLAGVAAGSAVRNWVNKTTLSDNRYASSIEVGRWKRFFVGPIESLKALYKQLLENSQKNSDEIRVALATAILKLKPIRIQIESFDGSTEKQKEEFEDVLKKEFKKETLSSDLSSLVENLLVDWFRDAKHFLTEQPEKPGLDKMEAWLTEQEKSFQQLQTKAHPKSLKS